MSFSFLDKLASSPGSADKDVFDSITCPNTFDDDSQVDQFFDTHKSTPSPKLRRSQRLKKKQSGGKENVPEPVKKVVEIKTPPKASSGTSYASCSSSTPFATPSADMKKATTTPGPPPRSLLKVAIGNSLRHKTLHDDVTIVAPPKRTGPQTSTPKLVTKANRVSKVVKDHQSPAISEAPGTVKRVPQRKTVVAANSKTVVKSEAVRAIVKRKLSTSTVKPAPHVTAKGTYRVVAPRIDVASSRAASVKSTAQPGTTSGQPQTRATKKSIGEKMNPAKPAKRKSLKTIVKKRQSDVKNTEAIKNRVAAARKAAADNRSKPATRTVGQYGHVKSRVAEMIHGGPKINAPNVRDMKRRADDAKAVKKVLHDKPFLPAGKVKYNAAVEVVPGDLTVNGQTMAQFVKNFQYQTPPRYRSMKPTDRFQNTCVNHTVQGPNPTVPKSPKFATKGRRRNPVKQV